MEKDFIEKIKEAVSAGDFDTAELLFLEEAEKPEGKLHLLKEAASLVASAGELERAGEMLASLQKAAEEAGPEEHLSLLRQLCLWLPTRRPWRKAFVKAFTGYFGEDEQKMAFLKAADIVNSRDVKEAFDRLETLLQLTEGSYLEHPGGWGVGKVKKVVPLTGHIEVDLERRWGHRVNLGAAATIFRPLPADHFSALLFDRKQELVEMAEKDPVKLLRIVLRSFGSPQVVSEIRNRLVPSVIPKEKWSNWWNRARSQIRNDPYLRLSGAPKAQLELLQKPSTEFENLLHEFKTKGGRSRAVVAKKFKNRPPEEKRAILEAISQLSGGPEAELEKLLLLYILGEEKQEQIASFIEELGQRGPDVVQSLDSEELAKEALRIYAHRASAETLSEYFLRATEKTIDEAASLLREKDPEHFKSVLREVFDQSRKYPLQFFWMTKARSQEAWSSLLGDFEAKEFLLRHIALLDFLFRGERRQQARALIAFGRHILTGDKFSVFKNLLAQTPSENFAELREQIQVNRVLKESAKVAMLEQLLIESHRRGEEAKESVTTGVGDFREVIYSSKEALQRKREEYQKLVQEIIPEVIREVGRAQEFGDLSENAEWTAALEKRDQLAKRANEIETELKRAVPITRDMYRHDRVSLGCRFVIRDRQTGETHCWRLLGPWDSEIYPDALSYLSPIGQAVLGKAVGEETVVELPQGRCVYVIEKIEPALPD